jgi:hypothetical protein
MLNRFFAVLVACMLLQTVNAVGQAAVPTPPNLSGGGFRIAGRIVDAKTGYPIARARVSAFDTRNPQRSVSMLSLEDGRFEFSGLPAGKFALEGAKRGFIRAAYDQHDQFSTAIVTGAGLETDNLVLRLDPMAVLTGKVLDEAGEPVRHAGVTIYREDRFSGVSRIRPFRNSQTDDRGFYELAPLRAGTYFVSADARPWYEIHPAKSQQSGADSLPNLVDSSLDVTYGKTYYGDATESDEATPIPVRGGDHLEADIHLTPVPALHLLMQAPDDRNGMSMPLLQKRAFDSEEPVSTGGMQPISQGLYEITGIPAGRYEASFVSNGQFGASTQVDLTTDGQELSPSNAQPPITVSATVHILGQSNIPPNMVLALRDARGRTVAVTEVGADGQVDFGAVIPGKYDLLAGSSDNGYSVVRISSQTGESSGHSVNVISGSPMNLSLSLVAGVTNVEGFAKRAGKAAPGVMIALVPNDPENNRELFRRDQSDLDGSFNLRSVIPGTYTVIAIENGWDLDWAQPAVIAHYAQKGGSVTITEHSPGTVHLSHPVEVQAQ